MSASQALPQFNVDAYTLAEVELNKDLWEHHRAYLRNQQVRGHKQVEHYRAVFDGAPYVFKAGEPKRLPLNVANQLVAASAVWQLKRSRDGRPVLEIDHEAPRLPLLEIKRIIKPQLQVEERREPIQLNRPSCPLCKERPEFETAEDLGEHLETVHGAAKANSQAGAARRKAAQAAAKAIKEAEAARGAEASGEAEESDEE